MRILATRIASLLIVSIFALYSPASFAQEKLLTIDEIFDPTQRIDFTGATVRVRWLSDGKHYLQTRRNGRGNGGQLMKVEAATGSASPFIDTQRMQKALQATGAFTEDQARAASNRTTFQFNEKETAVLLNHASDLFYYEFGSETAKRLTNTPAPEEEEDFSPDSRIVSFVRGNNLYTVDISSAKEVALTNDGSPKIFNGKLDWVYQEEIYGRGDFRAYWWSPDSSQLAFLRLDENAVKEFTVVDHIPRLQEVETTAYPKAGDPNPTVRLGIARFTGGTATWADLGEYEADEPLVVRVGWLRDSSKAVFQIQNREQTWLDLNRVDPKTGKTDRLLRETSKAWVDAIAQPYWLKDGSFLWLSERTGWQHIYHYSANGKLIRPVTEGKWEARSLHGVDQSQGLVYFSGTQHSHIATNGYRVKLDGTGMQRLTPKEGTHALSFNPTYTHFVDTWSDLNTPPVTTLHSANGELVRSLSEPTPDSLSKYRLGKAELLQVKTRDGFTMEAMMIKPPSFDPSKKYPVLQFTYGGPHAPQVRNAWGGATYLWHQMLAQKGYIIWVCDNRTASGKGAESVWPVYRNFGELELRDIEDGLSWLKKQLYIDGSRIGIWGWSYGGYMTCYALTRSKSFKLGIAGGSVTDFRLYDTIYTERYMQTPQKNAEGYNATSMMTRAADLNGKLLLIHGAMDDNVHMQNTIQFVYALQKAGKQFDLMVYPKSRHGVVDPLLLKHMRSMMTDFIVENL